MDGFGERRLDRREMLRASAAVAFGVPFALAGCGTTIHKAQDGTDYELAVNVGPQTDLIRLITNRAKATGMSPQLIDPALGGAAAMLSSVTARSKLFVAQDNGNPITVRLALIGATQASTLEPVAAAAIKNGVKIVSYPVALEHASAAIVADPVQAATLLATNAAAWANKTIGGRGHVLLVLPTTQQRVMDPYAPFLRQIEQTVRTVLAHQAPGLEIRTTKPLYATDGSGVSRLLQLTPRPQLVLSYDDATAVQVAQEARAQLSKAARRRLYVGALALPAVSSRATFDELQRDSVLRAVVGARLRDLANAMVDVPSALLNGGSGGRLTLALQILTPYSPALATYQSDYAHIAANTSTSLSTVSNGYLNREAQGKEHPTVAAPKMHPST